MLAIVNFIEFAMSDKLNEKLMWAARNGDLECLKEEKFDADAEINGTPLLVSAADYGQVEVIKFLIKRGANVNKPSVHGITPVLAALYENHVDAVQVLLKEGAKKDGKCPDGSSYVDAAETSEMKALFK